MKGSIEREQICSLLIYFIKWLLEGSALEFLAILTRGHGFPFFKDQPIIALTGKGHILVDTGYGSSRSKGDKSSCVIFKLFSLIRDGRIHKVFQGIITDESDILIANIEGKWNIKLKKGYLYWPNCVII